MLFGERHWGYFGFLDDTITKKRRISHEPVDDDDQQNVDEIYEECGDADGDLQQADNVINDECKYCVNNIIFNNCQMYCNFRQKTRPHQTILSCWLLLKAGTWAYEHKMIA